MASRIAQRYLLPFLLVIVSLLGLNLVFDASEDPLHITNLPAAKNLGSASDNESTPRRFVAIGDTGSGLVGQRKVAQVLAQQHAKTPFSFVVMLGDNIYPDGNVAKYGKERFLIPYHPLLSQGVRFYACLGNHDMLGGFAKDVMAFFHMPGPYYEFKEGDIRFFVINTNQFNRPQQQWLASRLKVAQEPWKIVYGHHPVYSSGMHGSSSALQRDLKPLLEMYRVNLYLSGHDHNYERFAPKNGVYYLVSGGGGASLRKFHRLAPGSLVRLSVHHFLLFEQKDNALTFDMIDSTGKVRDSGTIPMAKPLVVKPAA